MLSIDNTGAPLGPQAAMGPGNFLEGGNREVTETVTGWGRSEALQTLCLPRDHPRLCQHEAPKDSGWVPLPAGSLLIHIPRGIPRSLLPGPICSLQDPGQGDHKVPFLERAGGKIPSALKNKQTKTTNKKTWKTGHALETLEAVWGHLTIRSLRPAGAVYPNPVTLLASQLGFTGPLCALVSHPL